MRYIFGMMRQIRIHNNHKLPLNPLQPTNIRRSQPQLLTSLHNFLHITHTYTILLNTFFNLYATYRVPSGELSYTIIIWKWMLL